MKLSNTKKCSLFYNPYLFWIFLRLTFLVENVYSGISAVAKFKYSIISENLNCWASICRYNIEIFEFNALKKQSKHCSVKYVNLNLIFDKKFEFSYPENVKAQVARLFFTSIRWKKYGVESTFLSKK